MKSLPEGALAGFCWGDSDAGGENDDNFGHSFNREFFSLCQLHDRHQHRRRV